MKQIAALGMAMLIALWCGMGQGAQKGGQQKMAEEKTTGMTATFAGGCFWCLQHDLDHVPGVISTTAGYMGGDKKNPTYEEVSAGGTGYLESVQVVFDPKKITSY